MGVGWEGWLLRNRVKWRSFHSATALEQCSLLFQQWPLSSLLPSCTLQSQNVTPPIYVTSIWSLLGQSGPNFTTFPLILAGYLTAKNSRFAFLKRRSRKALWSEGRLSPYATKLLEAPAVMPRNTHVENRGQWWRECYSGSRIGAEILNVRNNCIKSNFLNHNI